MNISDKLLTEVESSNLAGVGIDTLNKYSEIGLLDTIVKENQKFYYENDIKTLFYAQLKVRTTPVQETKEPEEPPSEVKATAIVENIVNNDSAPIEQQATEETANTSQKDSQEKIAVNSENEKSNTPMLNSDNFFPSSLELLEINKSLKEQIQILREDRNWLRERIEKLETRSEREQMLLLSESENLRSMIKVNKRTFWEKALPWFTKS